MKTIAHSKTEQVRPMRYQYLNSQRRLFGGALMQWIDELAGTVAYRHCGVTVITAAVDSLIFRAPTFLEDLVVMTGQITYIGSTSMEVRIDSYAENAAGKRLINTAYLVMVALGDDGNPIPVPMVQPQTDEEKREWELGAKRHALRKQRRAEQY